MRLRYATKNGASDPRLEIRGRKLVVSEGSDPFWAGLWNADPTLSTLHAVCIARDFSSSAQCEKLLAALCLGLHCRWPRLDNTGY